MTVNARTRTSCVASIAAVALMSLLVGPGMASANKGDTAQYDYKVTKFDFAATGQLDAGVIKNVCTPFVDSLWTGSVKTDDAEVAPLNQGKGSLAIGKHGTEGSIEAKSVSESKFVAFHSEVIECDENGYATAYQNMDCTDSHDNDLTAFVSIDGGVGDKVKVEWNLMLDDSSFLVWNAFTCKEPFEFPVADCKTAKLPISKFTVSKNVKLSVKCHGEDLHPPFANNYSQYGASVRASATIGLHRTKQH